MSLSEIWTLEADGVEKTLAAWGVSAAQITRKSQAADMLDLHFGQARFDAPLLFAFEQKLTLRRGGVKWFVGVVTETPRMARPNTEGVRYRVKGPWYWLENTPYEQAWSQYNTGAEFPTSEDQSRVILGADQSGAPITTGAQIALILNYALAAGAAFQTGPIDPALIVPTDEATDPSCAEAIIRMLRWHPNCVTWFDYSTSPHPTLYIRARGNLAALTLPCAGAPAHTLDIQERPDLIPSVVALKYTITDDEDGEQRRRLVLDKYPALSLNRPRALVLTVSLQGNQATYLKQFIKAETIQLTSAAWWKKRMPLLADGRIKNFAFANGGEGPVALLPDEDGGPTYSRELIEGSIADWMSASSAPAVAKAQVNYDVEITRDGKTITEQHRDEIIEFSLTTTNASTGWFTALGSSTPAEPIPSGVAQAYYQACAALQWQGTFDFLRAEVDTAAVGRKLNLTGGLAAWATMDALIYAATEDLVTGRVSVQFGPVSYLAPADRLALARVNRRRVEANRYERAEALVTGGAQVPGHIMPRGHSNAGAAGPPKQVINVGDKTVTVDVAGVAPESIPSDLTVQLRSEHALLGAGDFKQRLVLASEPYAPDVADFFSAAILAALNAAQAFATAAVAAAMATLNTAIAAASAAASAAQSAAAAAQSAATAAQTTADAAQTAAESADTAAEAAKTTADAAKELAESLDEAFDEMLDEGIVGSVAQRLTALEQQVFDDVTVGTLANRVFSIEEFLDDAGYVVVIGADGRAYGLTAFEIEDLGDRRETLVVHYPGGGFELEERQLLSIWDD